MFSINISSSTIEENYILGVIFRENIVLYYEMFYPLLKSS